MESRRSHPRDPAHLTNGPGKLCQAMDISRPQNGQLLYEKESSVWIEDGPAVPAEEIVSDVRIGIDYAESWKDMPWRFYIRQNPFVSRY